MNHEERAFAFMRLFKENIPADIIEDLIYQSKVDSVIIGFETFVDILADYNTRLSLAEVAELTEISDVFHMNKSDLSYKWLASHLNES